MSSQTAICNRALTKLGAARILSITDDVKAARDLNSMWDIVLEAELRKNVWNFAVTRTSLPALVSVPAWEYTYQYQVPSDFLRLLQVGEYFVEYNSYAYYAYGYEARACVPYQLEQNKILTNYAAPLKIKYVKLVTDPQQWDSLFSELMATSLALECCESITQSDTKIARLEIAYRKITAQAMLCDAIENPSEPIADGPWVTSRLL